MPIAYHHLLFTAERQFWRCVQSGEPLRLFALEPPKPRLEAVRVVAFNSRAEFAAIYWQTRAAHEDHEAAKTNLKKH